MTETTLATGIPTARNVDHIAYTVPDLERAIAFCTTVLGAQLLYRQGPVADPDGDFMRRQLGVHPRAACQVALLRFGPVTNLELFEYRAPVRRRRPPRVSDVGGHHIAIRVDDLDAAVRHLAAQPGVRVLGTPQPPWCGVPGRWVQWTTPWGMRMELVEHDPAAPARGRYVPTERWHGGIPTARAVDHVGYTVPDLEQAVAFFTGPLGGRLVDRAEAIAGRQLGITGAAWLGTAVVRLGPVTNVELQCFHTTGQRTRPPRNSDVGGHHLAFFVDDLDHAVTYLRAVDGIDVLGEPQLVAEGGPIDGDRWIYFRAPWGFQLEALNLPPALPYERFTTARRFGPAPRWHNG